MQAFTEEITVCQFTEKRVGAIKTTKTPARIMLVSKIVRPQDRLKRGLKQAIKALLGAVARQKTRAPLIKHGILTYLDRRIQFFVARIRFYGSNSTINCAKLIFSFFTDFVEILAFKW